jgi:tryptophan-rich sensory protein
MNRPTKLIIALALPLAAGFIGSLVTAPAIPSWYAGLIKPSFSPPNWLFAPVWTTLYILMGIALYRIVVKTSWRHPAVKLFLIHLILNAFWSIAFFGLKSPLLGFLVILALLAMIAAIIWKLYRLDRSAAYLLMPYLAWVTFATLLNFSIWWLN